MAKPHRGGPASAGRGGSRGGAEIEALRQSPVAATAKESHAAAINK
jgi:hypothetical protein